MFHQTLKPLILKGVTFPIVLDSRSIPVVNEQEGTSRSIPVVHTTDKQEHSKSNSCPPVAPAREPGGGEDTPTLVWPVAIEANYCPGTSSLGTSETSREERVRVRG